jgi:mannose-6-phosphate isomerase-like protein (cupin superfamily)
MLGSMEYVTLVQQRRFQQDKMQKVPVFDSDKFYFDQYCLLPGQQQRVHTHDHEDKIYVVLEGEALFDIGNEVELLAAGTAVIARAGVPHGVRNDSSTPLILLVAMAPKPHAS